MEKKKDVESIEENGKKIGKTGKLRKESSKNK